MIQFLQYPCRILALDFVDIKSKIQNSKTNHMKAYFNLAIWTFTIICLSHRLDKCSDNILYSSSFSGRYISSCHIRHSLLFTKAANNLEIQDDEYKESSNGNRRASESSISSTDFSSSDLEFSGYDDSFSSSDESSSDNELPNDGCIASRLKSYLALRLPDKFGQPSNSLKDKSLSSIDLNSRHYDTVCDSDSDDSDSSSLFPTDGDIVTRLKTYLASKLPEKFGQPSNSPRRTKSLSSISLNCGRYDTAHNSDDSFDSDSFSSDDSDDDLARSKTCNFNSLPDLCSEPLDKTCCNQRTVNSEGATALSIHPESALPKSYKHSKIYSEKSPYSKRQKSSRSGFLSLRPKVISLDPLLSTRVVSYRSPNPILEPSCVDQRNPRSDVGPHITNCCSVPNIRLATPTKTKNKRVVKKDVHRKSRSNSLSMHSPIFSKKMPDRQKSAISKSAFGSSSQGSSFQSFSVISNAKSSSKRRAPLPPAHPPYSVKTETKNDQKRQAPPPPTYPPCSVKAEAKNYKKCRAPSPPTNPPYFVKTETKNHQKRRAPPPPTHPPYSVKTEAKNYQKRRAPPPPTHSKSSVKARTRSSNKRRAPSPPSTQPFSLEHSPPPSSQESTLLPPIQSSSQSSQTIRKSLSAVASYPRRCSSSPPSLTSSPSKYSSLSSSSLKRSIRKRSSSLPPKLSQRHKPAPTKSTSESSQSSQSKQKPPRPPSPTIQSIHIYRMFNA